MRSIIIGDLYHQRIKFMPDDMLEYFMTFNDPGTEIINAIRKYIEIPVKTKEDTPEEAILSLLMERKVLTSMEAIEDGAVKYPALFTKSISNLREMGHDIKAVQKSRPRLYYLGVSEYEAKIIYTGARNIDPISFGRLEKHVEIIKSRLENIGKRTHTSERLNDGTVVLDFVKEVRAIHPLFRLMDTNEIFDRCKDGSLVALLRPGGGSDE